MTRVAAIDCGTNSIRLLIADIETASSAVDSSAIPQPATAEPELVLTDVVRIMRVVRLGQGVDQTGQFAAEALERTFEACEEYARLIAESGAVATRFVATSASRDVSNRDEFIAGVQARLGVTPEVISGDEEAQLSFIGALSALPADVRAGAVLVVDIGGGSTEFVVGCGGSLQAAKSVDIGCVRMTERWLRDDPPTPAQVEGATVDIDAAIELADSIVDISQATTLIGLAGSVTTVAAIAMDLPEYDSSIIHGSTVSMQEVDRVAGQLLGQTHAERAKIPVMHPGRVDVIGGGALVLDRIMHKGGFDYAVVSEHDILDGIALALAR